METDEIDRLAAGSFSLFKWPKSGKRECLFINAFQSGSFTFTLMLLTGGGYPSWRRRVEDQEDPVYSFMCLLFQSLLLFLSVYLENQ